MPDRVVSVLQRLSKMVTSDDGKVSLVGDDDKLDNELRRR